MAMKVLFSKPDVVVPADTEPSSTPLPPFEMAFAGFVHGKAPVQIFERERFRVCIYPAADAYDGCGKAIYWLTMEFKDGTWKHMLTLHEAKLPVMMGVLQEVAAFVADKESSAVPEVCPQDW
jgi:hypothetical protein